MGQAKRQLARQIIERAFPNEKVRLMILLKKFRGDHNAFANEIIRRAVENANNASLDLPSQISDTSCD